MSDLPPALAPRPSAAPPPDPDAASASTVDTDVAVAAASSTPAPIDRELAILAFNRRVLAQARRPDVPLLERLRYVCIVSSNLDEFFEVRIADIREAARKPGSGVTLHDLDTLADAAHRLIDAQYRVFNDEVMPALAAHGVRIVGQAERTPADRQWVQEFFEREVRPLLVPVGLDPAHPFPQVANKSLNFIARLRGKHAFGRRNSVAIVKVPRVLPRVIRLPGAPDEHRFVLLTSVIRAHLDRLFPGRQVEDSSQFRLTRDADLEIDGEITNLRQALRSELSTRNFGNAMRLEVVRSCPPDLRDFLMTQFALPAHALYAVDGPVNLVRLDGLVDLVNRPALRFPAFEPAWPTSLGAHQSIFERIRQGNLLLHQPFESFEPVVDLLREAVLDPDVLAIKQTIYRAGGKSPLMDLLIEGARRGKEVMVVVELKARFDEEANIGWAERLEAVGAQVVYGVVGLKTHAKMLLVTRRERGALRRYAHLSTGNYNARSARLYTDIGYFTAGEALTEDVDAVFQQLASLGRTAPLREMLQAPFTLHRSMLAEIGRVADAAGAGRRARIVLKLNALTEPLMIQALQAAARAGAEIDLIVRGACTLAAGTPSEGRPIRVRSIVGRFLEHTRIAYFAWGDATSDESLWLSSADWMTRNMYGRIEVAWPVRDEAHKRRLIDECLVPYLLDGRDAWTRDDTGEYRPSADPEGVSAQAALAARYSARPTV